MLRYLNKPKSNNMKTLYVEHANITVNNLDRGIDLYKTAFPDFKIRGGGWSNGRKWIYLGNEESYIALNESLESINYSSSGINHLDFVVENIQIVTDRLIAAGYKRNYLKAIEGFRIRDYFADDDGNQYEFIEYLSNKIEEKNKY